ncbi:BON domain-containing protein [Actimicrobium antarcticum]|uniref:BON domain-containing protein n=1 Tax=Actimicrobium antarcticum TaxID=1051899 RepID=A0ABP7TLB8_9BURK
MTTISGVSKSALVVVFVAAILSGCNRQSDTATTPSSGGTVAGSSVVAAVDDSIITTKIKTALLADPIVKGTEVKVATTGGAVALSGAVETQAQIDQAKKVAEAVAGVKSVSSNLTLKK